MDLPVDKDHAMMILSKEDYTQIIIFLQCPAYKKLAKNPAEAIEWKTATLIWKYFQKTLWCSYDNIF
jgi:hypothetical protein